ncbi:hypothetical protein S40288_09890 [Stachybotrys chartarum IBT 40288]|nr:hypothetical protein S40288_09890 [Stachybotrys chartarum IBT 40288]
MTFTCGTCWREFPAGWNSREQHLKAKGHQAPPFECNCCDRYFGGQHAVEQHMNALGHWVDEDYYECDDCSETFPDEQELHDHENGMLHNSTAQPCLRSRDPNSFLTKKLLTMSNEGNYEATESAFNTWENAYECYFCHRRFERIGSLNQHLNSPAHKENLYHCPNSRCGKDFGTLAAVVNHWESESCGFLGFEAVQETTKRIIDPRRMISFRNGNKPTPRIYTEMEIVVQNSELRPESPKKPKSSGAMGRRFRPGKNGKADGTRGEIIPKKDVNKELGKNPDNPIIIE